MPPRRPKRPHSREPSALVESHEGGCYCLSCVYDRWRAEGASFTAFETRGRKRKMTMLKALTVNQKETAS